MWIQGHPIHYLLLQNEDMANLAQTEQRLKKVVLKFEEDLQSIRTGKAHVSMIENILVESYGIKTPISHVASISTPDAKSIIVKPWDKNLMPTIEVAIQKANLGVQPISDKDQIRLSLPPLTEERRKELTKVVGKKMEEARISARQIRDEFRKEIQHGEQEGKISENQKFSENKKMEAIVEEVNRKIAEIADKKEKEILTI